MAALQHLLPALADPRGLMWAVLSRVPGALKWTAVALVLLNVRSFPFMWHFRVFLPVLRLHLIHFVLRVRLLFASPRTRAARIQAWLDSLSPVGISPFDLKVTHKAWAGPDDCDYNFHLSNSCYPKILDGARLKAALQMCPSFFRAGGWLALGATHHHFIREIPIFAHYESRMTIGAWDQKWIYVIVRFVTLPKKGTRRHTPAPPSDPSASAFPALHTPATPLDTSDASGSATPADPGAALPALARAQAALPEPDGATLHCVAVSVMVCKHGRITVPPGVVFAGDGMHRRASPTQVGSSQSEEAAKGYSAANPPRAWTERAQPLRTARNVKEYVRWLRGGWKEERWWEDAMGGEVEEERRRRLSEVEGLRIGLEGARGCL